MSALNRSVVPAYWIAVVLLFAAALWMALFYAPVESTMGWPQKIFYLHLPIAITTFGACTVVFIGSLGYLWQKRLWWDDLAEAGGKVAVLFCAVVLLTGMTWGRSAWGLWWTWSPRLTLTLVLLLLYGVYLMLRPAIESRQRAAIICAVYGIAAFLDVPLVYLSVRLIPDIHPTAITLTEPSMKLTLAFWFIPVLLLAAGLIASRYGLNRQLRAREEASVTRQLSMPAVQAPIGVES